MVLHSPCSYFDIQEVTISQYRTHGNVEDPEILYRPSFQKDLSFFFPHDKFPPQGGLELAFNSHNDL